MIRLTAVLKRKPGMSPEAFHAHWRDVHGPLVASTTLGRTVTRYEQHHRPLDDYRGEADDGWDGVAVQLFESREDFYAAIQADDAATVTADEENFLDRRSIVWLLTEEPIVVIDR